MLDVAGAPSKGYYSENSEYFCDALAVRILTGEAGETVEETDGLDEDFLEFFHRSLA